MNTLFSDSLNIVAAAWRAMLVCALTCTCAACAYERNLSESDMPADIDGEGSELIVSPDRMGRFAYERITVSGLPFEATEKTEITVGGLPCINVRVENKESLSCMVLPNCASGPQTIVLRSGDEEISAEDIFEFESAGEPIFDGFMAIGGGWMAGARNGALYQEAQLTSIASYVARRTHSCMPLPLATPEGFPALFELKDIDTATGHLRDEDISAALEPFMSGKEDISSRRIHPGETALPALPFISAGDEIDGVALGSRAAAFERFVRPYANEESIMDEILRRKPGFIIADFEFFAFSTHAGHFEGGPLRREEIEVRLGRFFNALNMLDSPPYLFVLNAPPLNILPARKYSELARYESIWINDAINRNVILANEALRKKGLGDRFFSVDLYGFIYGIAKATTRVDLSGLDLPTLIEDNEEADLIVTDSSGNRQQLGFDLFEGFFSLDGYHPTATGAAAVANLLIDRINAELGPQSARRLLSSEIEPVDIEAVLADDPLSPLHLEQSAAALGFPALDEYQDAAGLPQLHTAHYCAIQWGGNMPEYKRCPTKVSVLSDDDPLQAAPDDSVNVKVFLKVGDRNKKDWPIMAYSVGLGKFIGDAAITDFQGFADFVYDTAAFAGSDTLIFYSGDAFCEREILISNTIEEGL